MTPPPPAGRTSDDKRRNGWSPSVFVLLGFFLLIAAVGIYLALPKYELSGVTIKTIDSKTANKPSPPKNAVGSAGPTRHAVYGTPGENTPAPSGFGSDSRPVRTTREGTTSPAPVSPVSKPFTAKSDTEVAGEISGAMNADSAADCQQKCAASSSTCTLFSFNKGTGQCFFYTSGELHGNPLFDSGIRTMRAIRAERVDPFARATAPSQGQK